MRLKGEADVKHKKELTFFRESGYTDADIDVLVRQYKTKRLSTKTPAHTGLL
jgi:hypothetical protein